MSKITNLTCVVCPAGCKPTVEQDDTGEVVSVTGNTCPRGKTYAEAELTHPVRTLTTTVAIDSNTDRRLPVKTDKPIPKEAMFRAMEEIKKIRVTAPVKRGDVIAADFMEPGINLVSCKTVE